MSEYADGTPTETARLAFVLEGKGRDLGGFTVRRVLPSVRHRRVGPFVFFDHLGPFTVTPEHEVMVRPHPHIGLATVTYLFDGEIVHRDSLGSKQPIVPGDVNWMTAGRGIVHSERTRHEVAVAGGRAHGLQCWVGLPAKDEECDPTFAHYAAADIPTVTVSGVALRVVVGSAYGVTSPVRVLSPTIFVDAAMTAGQTLELPEGYAELAIYVVEGRITCDDVAFVQGTMLIPREGQRPGVRAEQESRVVIVGGASLDGERFLFWNFVSSRKERLEQAKRDWKEGRFPKVPGDELEFIPLPEGS
jgi:redox-sensitive bicupin YhaK (pirin superfamily)